MNYETYVVLVSIYSSKVLKMLQMKIRQSYNYFTEIQYGKELKEVIMNNRVTYGMDILERQSEISAHDKNSNQLAATSVKQSERNDNKVAKKECKSN